MLQPVRRLERGRVSTGKGATDMGTVSQEVAMMAPAPAHSSHVSPKATKVLLYPEPRQTGHLTA